MTIDEAFETLGVEPPCSPRELRRAYHRQIKRYKPDRDPEQFRKVRDAYELAQMFVDRPRGEVLDDEPESRPEPDPTHDSPFDRPPEHDVDPSAVLEALEASDLQHALTQVMDERWANALLDDFEGALTHITYRVACAAVLLDLQAFAALEARYREILSMSHGDTLGHLLAVAESWAQLLAQEDIPPALTEFVSWVSVATTPQRTRLGSALGQWFMNDPHAAMRRLKGLRDRWPRIAEFLQNTLDEMQLAACPALPSAEGTPASTLRGLFWRARIFVALAGITVALVWYGLGAQASVVVAVLFAWLSIDIPRHIFRGDLRLQTRFVLACLGADLSPQDAVFAIPPGAGLRDEIRKNPLLALGFSIGQLARLAPESPANTP